MTEKRYRLAVNACLCTTATAALTFDSFPNHLIPGGAIIVAGLAALLLNIYSTFCPVEGPAFDAPSHSNRPSTDLKELAVSVGQSSVPARKMAAAAKGTSRVNRGVA